MTEPQTTTDECRFLSAALLRAFHGGLRKRYVASTDKASFADEIEEFVARGRATGTLLDDEDDRWACQSVLDYWLTTLYEHGRSNADSTLEDFDPGTAPDLPDDACPYMGLGEFREENAELFCGRKNLVIRLIGLLKDNPLILVAGSSGSGKSSLVMAGLIPALKADKLPGSKAWTYLPPIVPGENPNKNLETALETSGGESASDGDTRFLLVDQFEELFTLCHNESEREIFCESIAALIKRGDRAVLTIRNDHVRENLEPFLAKRPALESLFGDSHLSVTPLSAPDLRKAIERPARRVGLKFDKGVVDRLVEDLVGEPSGLPLLQFTLMKLWENRTRNRITIDAYNELGGGLQALKRSADKIYDSLLPEDQRTAKKIFLKLVQPGESMEYTRRRIPVGRLHRAGGDSERVDRVLQRLIDAQLIRKTTWEADSPVQLEVVHEALLRNWPRLADWIEDARHELRQRLKLSKAGEEWLQQGKPNEFLYRGAKLDAAEQSLSAIEDDLTIVGASFLEAGRNLRDEEERKSKLRNQQEERMARELDEAKGKILAQTQRLSPLIKLTIRNADEVRAARKKISSLRWQLVTIAGLDSDQAIVLDITDDGNEYLAKPVAKPINRSEKIQLPCQLETTSGGRVLLALPNRRGLLALDENTRCAISAEGVPEKLGGVIATEGFTGSSGRKAQVLFDKGKG